MNKIWTLIASTMLVASAAFAQDDFDSDYANQTEEQYTEQEQAEVQADEQQQAAEPAEEEEQPSVAEEPAPSKPVAAPVTQASAQEPAQESTQNDENAQEAAPRDDTPFFGFGLRTAFDYGRMYGFKDDLDNDSDISGIPSGIGFEAGVMFRIQMIPNLYFAPEVNFAYISTEHEYLKHKREYKSIDMEIPLLMRGVVADRFYVTAGPQLNFSLSSEADIEPVENSVLNLTFASTEKIEQASFGFGIAAGLGINIVQGLFFDLRYYMGITELYPDVKTLDDMDIAEGDFSLVDMSGARMMKFKVGISYWFL
ncbi:Outer membrane protein beta-barrel domain-containing protein [Fibrobacter sp. UWB15]|uniref:porin family protein n=1 Tax=unclassified Fibrobacter TaxID=2634177 RepID=UPI000921ED40|nr:MULTISPECIES: porin family protein [unclassified Fibrobacter]PWJ62343.1 outer membrane protein with beta-barrel domain [Fibrobacter sp. UWB6]SHG52192.1 Outer membrane protein beta-barrel domain-containing protein [Fibrobacter sp. UWB8]SMG40481.1 Outer membrane protein beta-barrel domain-containing protein [Fibrobacter sp. UWB15]